MQPDPSECQICSQGYNETDVNRTPRILTTCGHTVCQECAGKLKAQNPSILCPFDRKETRLSGSVETLPKNFTVLELIRVQQQEEEKDKEDGPFEGPGPEVPCVENRRHEANVFCRSCDAVFCDKCYEKVHAPAVMSRHQKADLADQPIHLPNCPTHPELKAEFLCEDRKCAVAAKVMCTECRRFLHKNHTYSDLLVKLVENQSELEQHLDSILAADAVRRETVEHASEALASYDPAHDGYQEKIAEISEHFERMKRAQIEKFEERVTTKKIFAEYVKANCEDDLKMAEETVSEINRRLKTKTGLHDVTDLLAKALHVSNAEPVHFDTIESWFLGHTREGIQMMPVSEI